MHPAHDRLSFGGASEYEHSALFFTVSRAHPYIFQQSIAVHVFVGHAVEDWWLRIGDDDIYQLEFYRFRCFGCRCSLHSDRIASRFRHCSQFDAKKKKTRSNHEPCTIAASVRHGMHHSNLSASMISRSPSAYIQTCDFCNPILLSCVLTLFETPLRHSLYVAYCSSKTCSLQIIQKALLG